MLRTTRKLMCKLTEQEIDERGRKAADLDQEKRALDAERKATAATFREQIKHLDAQIADLTEQATTGQELREVECEEREALVNGGGLEVVRLDTGEVIDTIHDDPETESPQPSLFDAPRPELPALRCTAIDADGCAFPISAEQADAADREIAEGSTARIEVAGPETGQGVIFAVKIVRGRACEFCGSADGNHRQPDCDDAKRDAAEADALHIAAHGFAGDDEHDTGALALQLAASPLPSDEPLVPKGDGAKPPKKAKKGKSAGADA